jgi:hypothetical protein
MKIEVALNFVYMMHCNGLMEFFTSFQPRFLSNLNNH